MTARGWRNGVSHVGGDVERFLKSLLTMQGRSLLYIAGAGFDPRSTHLAEIIEATGVKRFGLFIREERPDPEPELLQRGHDSQARLQAAFPDNAVLHIEIFSDDHVPVGDSTALRMVKESVIDNGLLPTFTDVIVDISALSIGVSFPIVGMLREWIEKHGVQANLHIIAATGGPRIEGAIVAEHAEGYQLPKGFKDPEPAGGEVAKRLWIPQLSLANRYAYEKLFSELKPAETCPVLPFPSREPRGVERLLDEFTRELVQEWRIEPRQMIYAAEDDPLDLYRSLARIHLARKDIYDRAGEKSQTILSPIGSKAMAIGALLAAIHFKLPVAYVEARRYQPPATGFTGAPDPAGFVHVWMLGEVYHRLAAAP